MREAQVDHVMAVQIGRLAKKRFGRVVMLARVEPVFIIPHMPAGEGARRLLDVVFRVISLAKAEKLHDLARKIFIRMPLAICVAIQPNEHGHILRHAV